MDCEWRIVGLKIRFISRRIHSLKDHVNSLDKRSHVFKQKSRGVWFRSSSVVLGIKHRYIFVVPFSLPRRKMIGVCFRLFIMPFVILPLIHRVLSASSIPSSLKLDVQSVPAGSRTSLAYVFQIVDYLCWIKASKGWALESLALKESLELRA